jgi:hypothetical protein
MTRQLTSAVSHKLLHSPHAQRLPPGGFVLTGHSELRLTGAELWVSATQLRCASPLGHLFAYLLASNFLVPMQVPAALRADA